MRRTDIFIGLFIGIVSALLGCYLFVEIFTPYRFMDGIAVFRVQQLLGKIITLGAILNIGIFFLLLQIQ